MSESPLGVRGGRAMWWLFAAMLAGLVAYVAVSFAGTLVFGLFIYYSTRPVHRRVRARIGRPNVAAAVALFVLALAALALVLYTVIVAARQLEQLTAIDLGGLDDRLPELLADPVELIADGRLFDAGSLDQLLEAVTSAADTLAFVGIVLLNLFVMVALAFYLLRDDHRLAGWALDQFGSDRGTLERYGRAVDRDLESIFFGNILNALFTGVIGATAFSLLNVVAPEGAAVPAAALFGLLAGVASLIPVVGMKLVYIPLTAYLALRAVTTGNTAALPFVGLFFAVSFVIVDSIPDLVLRPFVSGRSLHVGAVMLAYTLGPLLFGWYGIFLMPLLLVLAIQFARLVLPDLLAGAPGGDGDAGPHGSADGAASTPGRGSDPTGLPNLTVDDGAAGAESAGGAAGGDAPGGGDGDGTRSGDGVGDGDGDGDRERPDPDRDPGTGG
jgi:predicted PurR-regulated permease PerM